MHIYRLFEKNPFHSPLGFNAGGGRWNHSGTPLIYASNTISLPFLELYSIKGPVVATSSWILATLELSKEIPILQQDDLPPDWNLRPHTSTTKDFGTVWANSKDMLCIKVPSARIPLSAYPSEFNLLINPLHPDFFHAVKIISEEEVSFAINEVKK